MNRTAPPGTMPLMPWPLAEIKLDDTAIVCIGLGAVIFIYVTIVRPKSRRRDPLDRAPAFASLAQQRATERQMQSLLVDLSEMARQISSQLDSRAAKLELLIQQADQRLASLQSVNGSHHPVEPSAPPPELIEPTPRPSPLVVPEELPFPEPIDPAHLRIYTLADDGRNAGEIAVEMSRPKGEIELILALRGK